MKIQPNDDLLFSVPLDPTARTEGQVAQEHRLARHRERLLASGAFTISAIKELRGDKAESSTRTWMSRLRKRHALFTVDFGGNTLLPVFELRDGEPRPGLAPVLKMVVPSLPGIASDIKKEGVTELGYTRVPVRAAASLPALWRLTQSQLNEVTQPVLVYRSTVDHVVGPASLRVLRAGLPGDRLTVRDCPDSYHVATLDNDAPTIFAGSLEFVRAHSHAETE